MSEKIRLPIKFDDDFDLVDSKGFPLMYCADLVDHNPSIGQAIEMRVNLHDELVEALTLLLHEVAESGNYCANDFGWPEAIIKSEKALAKADGEK
jgi:hypothetical protein